MPTRLDNTCMPLNQAYKQQSTEENVKVEKKTMINVDKTKQWKKSCGRGLNAPRSLMHPPDVPRSNSTHINAIETNIPTSI